MSCHVLITRESERAQELIAALHEANVTAVAQPVTRTLMFDAASDLPDPSQFDWLIFTSVNGVRAFARQLSQAKYALPEDIKIAVVGETTAKALRTFERTAKLIAAENSARGLAESLIKQEPAGKRGSILWPCAAITDPEMKALLLEAGFRLQSLPVYRTENIPPSELSLNLKKIWPWKVAIFFAPSAVRSFTEAWPGSWDFASMAIGNTTAQALKDIGVPDPVVCPKPTTECLSGASLKLLKEYGKEL
ncbi:MAG: uroporphyrinogen-III synthase [Calditrichota bacterium]